MVARGLAHASHCTPTCRHVCFLQKLCHTFRNLNLKYSTPFRYMYSTLHRLDIYVQYVYVYGMINFSQHSLRFMLPFYSVNTV